MRNKMTDHIKGAELLKPGKFIIIIMIFSFSGLRLRKESYNSVIRVGCNLKMKDTESVNDQIVFEVKDEGDEGNGRG
jgi:hypothetical protein